MDAFVATILPVGFDWAPYGWSLCQGQLMQTQQYAAVYALIGNTYGGTPSQNFNLPDLRGRVPLNYGQRQVAGAVYYGMGNNGGNDAITLSQNQLPPHTHASVFTPTGTATVNIPAQAGSQTATLKANSVAGNTQIPVAGNALAGGGTSAIKTYAASAASQVDLDSNSIAISGNAPTAAQNVATNAITGGSVTVGVTGSGLPIDARSPFLAINFIFCIQGLFPTRP